MAALGFTTAVDWFTRGFAATRSRTHPCVVDRVGPVWYSHDGPRRDPRKERSREFVALSTTPVAAVLDAVATTGSRRYTLCVLHPGRGRDAAIESAYKARGFRCRHHEPMFVRSLPPVPRVGSGVRVERVTDAAGNERVKAAAGRWQIATADAERGDADARLFAAHDGDSVIGWVTSVRVAAEAGWVANLHVLKAHRNRGVGAALMRTMLRDDHGRGFRWSLLLASSLGARLYPKVGYEQIGTLQVFQSPKAEPAAASA